VAEPRRIHCSELLSHAGDKLGTSAWHTVSQDQVDRFAEATGDHYWIHVDPERARRSALGGTIAHGYLTLSLWPALLGEVVVVDGYSLVLNYGLNRVRFPTPVPVGSRVRLHLDLTGVEENPDSSLQTTFGIVVELEGSDKPCCVAESLFRYYP
jgi:acyl dehydratase